MKMTEREDTRSLHLVDTLLHPIPNQRRSKEHEPSMMPCVDSRRQPHGVPRQKGQGDTPMQVCQSGTQDATRNFSYPLSQAT